MTEEMKQALREELAPFKDAMKTFLKAEDLTSEVDKLKADLETKFGESLSNNEDFKELKTAAEQIGEKLTKMESENKSSQKKTIKDLLQEQAEGLKEMIEDGSKKMSMNVNKTVLSTNVTSDEGSQRIGGLPGEVKRGMPHMRNLFNIVTLGGDTHGVVSWYEQSSVTNNASNVAEGAASSTQSAIQWVQKTLGGARVHDFIKVSKNQLKDINFVAGEVNRLLTRNMRLKENSQLIDGTGASNQIKGVKQYATSFTTTGISIQDANLVDLLGKCRTQILNDGYDAWMPDYQILNPSDIDEHIRYKKDGEDRYLFPNWAMGETTSLAGVQTVENPLVTANELLIGDFGVGTIYEWDGLIVEIGFIDDDFTKGLVTISAYLRENLMIRDVDTSAIISIDDIDQAILDINQIVN